MGRSLGHRSCILAITHSKRYKFSFRHLSFHVSLASRKDSFNKLDILKGSRKFLSSNGIFGVNLCNEYFGGNLYSGKSRKN